MTHGSCDAAASPPGRFGSTGCGETAADRSGPSPRPGRRAKAAFVVLIAALSFAVVPSASGAPKGVVSTFGSQGAADGQFSTPRGIAVKQSSGDVYVVDSGNHRVQRFDVAGTFLSKFGTGVSGAGAGVFNSPQGIALDQTAGTPYVTDQNNRRVQKFAALDVFGLHAFDRTWGWGVQDGTAAFQICTASCVTGIAGAGDGQFGSTFSGHIAVDPTTGNVYVADLGATANRRVQKFDSSGNFLAKFGSSGSGAGQFGSGGPSRVAVDSTGAIYAVDPGNSRVQKCTSLGGIPETFSCAVFAATELSGSPAPTDVAVDTTNDHVFVVKPSSSPAERRVKEFDSSGTLVETHGVGEGITSVNGMALNFAAGQIYLSSSSPSHRVFVLDDGVPPTASIESATDIEARSATLNGTINPNGAQTTYRFEYSTDGVNWTRTPTQDASVGSGNTNVAVNQSVTTLEPDTEYRVRLVVDGWGAPVTTSEVTFTTDAIPPDVTTPLVVDVTADEATFKGVVNPNNDATSYRFEYRKVGDPDWIRVPATDEAIGAGAEPVAVSQDVSGLEPSTEYEVRLTAANGVGPSTSGVRPFTTLSDVTPPSGGRVYEMVSPPDKGDQSVLGDAEVPGGPLSSPSGEAVLYQARGAFGDIQSSADHNTYLATRSDTSWSSIGLSPPLDPNPTFSLKVQQLSEDRLKVVVLSTAALSSDGWNSTSGNLGEAMYVRDLTDDSYRLITREPVPGGAGGQTGPTPYRSRFIGADSDLNRVLFETTAELTSDAVPLADSDPKVYSWTDGTLALESVLPNGTPVSGSAGSGADADIERVDNGLSADGSRIFFSSPHGNNANRPLYVREGTVTTQISSGAIFRAATPDGDHVFFTDGEGLKRYDVESATSTFLSADHEFDDGGANVLGIAGVSNDGSRAFFVASGGQIVDGGPLLPTSQPKLYAWDDGSLKFVTGLRFFDMIMWGTSNLAHGSRYVPPGGDALLFASTGSLTGYNNASSSCFNDLCQEFFLYDPNDSTTVGPDLVCVSCNPSGAPPTGDAGNANSSNFLAPRARHVTDDGKRVFFASPDPLLPEDTNSKRDVYLWEGGELDLISTGQSEDDTLFSDASADGDDVFFATTQRLVGWDMDNAYDRYDARVGGGLPEPPESVPPCAGDECQGPPSGRPPLSEPGTVFFRGKGDLAESIKFRVARISAALKRRFARTGRLTLVIKTPRAGRLVARSNRGPSVTKQVEGPTTARLTLRLGRKARRLLLGRGRLRVRIVVQFGDQRQTATMTLRRSK